ncbi:hypothetical protein PVK06_046224 [Gossypium arboreum]|uniref:Uncharacterized protein n=1 Tax=Gossypium arboreum TaxID=29729 RepID=A0ABR0MCH0_GOSAR|nr:hypothetical protein PVK06_046224 [Gossypium arboreum]
MEATKNGNLVDVGRKEFETSKNMSEEVDDEADSAIVGKFDQFYEDYGYYETSDDEDEPYHSRGFKSLNTTEWETAIEGGT